MQTLPFFLPPPPPFFCCTLVAVKVKVVRLFKPRPEGATLTVIRQLRGYYDYNDSDRATTPGAYCASAYQLSLEPLAPILFSRVWIIGVRGFNTWGGGG